MTPKQLAKANDLLKAAREQEASKLTFQDGLIAVDQDPDGTSLWAELVREGLLKRDDVYWLIKKTEGLPVSWLAIRLDTGKGKPQLFDLTDQESKRELKALEAKMQKLLDKHNEENYPLADEDDTEALPW